MDEEILKYREFLNPPLGDRGYFNFEEDYIEQNVRCIPMIVRFKMDAACIKLKLSEWSKFTPEERIALAVMPVHSEAELKSYSNHLSQLVEKYTNSKATALAVDPNPGWSNLQNIPDTLIEKARDLGLELTLDKWKSLTNLQRFALLKLYKPGHENKNFPKAIKEFNLL